MADIEQVVLEISERMSNRWHKDKFSSMGGLFELAIREAIAHHTIRAHILQSAWRPISEAPKDGKEILVCWQQQGGVMQLIRWSGNGYWMCKGEPDLNMQASHFQPLPLPPTGGDDNG